MFSAYSNRGVKGTNTVLFEERIRLTFFGSVRMVGESVTGLHNVCVCVVYTRDEVPLKMISNNISVVGG